MISINKILVLVLVLLTRSSFAMSLQSGNLDNQADIQSPQQQILIVQFLHAVAQNNPSLITTLLESPDCSMDFKVSCDIALDFAKYLNGIYKQKKYGLENNILIINILKSSLEHLSITPADNLDQSTEEQEEDAQAE